jgi:hypothetical protein
MALRKLIAGEYAGRRPMAHRAFHQTTNNDRKGDNPREGWSSDVIAREGHLMLLLKPQIVLRSERDVGSHLVAVGECVCLPRDMILK